MAQTTYMPRIRYLTVMKIHTDPTWLACGEEEKHNITSCVDVLQHCGKDTPLWDHIWRRWKRNNKKAELPQRWLRDAPYVWMPWKFLSHSLSTPMATLPEIFNDDHEYWNTVQYWYRSSNDETNNNKSTTTTTTTRCTKHISRRLKSDGQMKKQLWN